MGLDSAAYELDPPTWVRDKLGIILDPWQIEVMRSTTPKLLLNCSRQSGKSTVSAALALWTAFYQPGSLTLCLSPTLRQSSELFHIISSFYGLNPEVPSKNESVLRLDLTNDSRIISLPGQEQNIRGYAASLIIVDEASRVSSDIYYALKPMLAVSRGRLLALSTPFGKRGWWHDEWVNGKGWERHEIPATKCPRIPKEFLESERQSMPSAVFESEYCCQFTEAEDSVFRYDDVMGMISDELEPLDLGGAW
jgi:hypothetical protein